MTYEMLVGLYVTEDNIYSEYRKTMNPILLKYGGGFRYDFKVAETLKSEIQNRINRVFTIYFARQDSKDNFFADLEYKAAKNNFFEKSMGTTTILAEYLAK